MHPIFELTKDRSAINGRYMFEFLGKSEQAVVPVLQRYRSGEYRIIGTAFFFLEPSLFLTASHMFEGRDINVDDDFYVVLAGDDEPVRIAKRFLHENTDIAILVLDDLATPRLQDINPLAVMDSPLVKGEVVAIFGFSHSLVDPDDAAEADDGVVFQPIRLRSKWELGGILECHPSGCRLIKGECYETSILAEGRDSGAPMFNSCGFVTGVLSLSGSYDDGLPNSLYTSILPLRDIPIDGIAIKDRWLTRDRAAICRPVSLS